MIKIELRNIDLTSEKDLVVQGLIPTESLSEVLKSGNKHFREKIARGAFTKSLSNKKDIDLLVEHDNKKILSSTRNDSLQLEESSSGLFLSAELAKTSLGNDYYELVKSGILRNLSFGFRVVKDNWESIGGEMIRTIKELDLSEVSIVRNAAYFGTEISARGIDVIENVDIPETKKTMKKDVVKTMEKIVKEKRSTQETISTEIRELITSEANLAVIPTHIADEIVKKMSEESPVFAMAHKFPTVNGNLRIPVEADNGAGSFVGEGQPLTESDLAFDYVDLTQKRVGAVLNLSKQLINDLSIDVDGYVADLLARKTAKAVEHSIIVGTGDLNDEFKGILNTEGLTEIETDVVGEVSMDDLNTLYTQLHPAFIDGAAFIMSRALFNKVARIKDTAGHYYVSNGIINGRVTYTLFGAPVFVSDALKDRNKVIFGNYQQSIGILIKQGPELMKIEADTEQALKGAILFLYQSYMDSAVINKQGLAVLSVKQA